MAVHLGPPEGLAALDFGKEARQYIRRGAFVLPCREDKKPATLHGVQDATNDLAIVDQWADELMCPQLEVACEPSGLVVLDIDDEEQWRAYKLAHGIEEPLTAAVRTPSDGRHLWFKRRAGANYPGRLCAGVEVKARGYALVPPSFARGRNGQTGRYSWLNAYYAVLAPAWLEANPASRSVSGPLSRPLPTANDGQLSELLDYIDPDADGYENWLKVLMCLHEVTGGSPEGLRLAKDWSARGPRYKVGEVEREWRGFEPGAGGGAAVIAATARKYGADLSAIARKHAPSNLEDDEPRSTYRGCWRGRTTRRRTSTAPPPMKRAGTGRRPLTTAEQLRSRTVRGDQAVLDTAVRSVVKGLLGQASLSVVYGDANVGKSFFVLDLANAVADENVWNGRRVKGGPVFYIASEGGAAMRNRLLALRSGASPNLHVIMSSVDLCSSALDLQAIVKLVGEEAKRTGPPAMLVIDTLARSLGGGDENSSVDMGTVIGRLDELRTALGAHVLAVHHTGKNKALGARGHSSLRAAVDTEIELSRPAQGARARVEVTKQRDLEAGQVFEFELVPVQLGIDDDSDPITSCFVDYCREDAVRTRFRGVRDEPVLEALKQFLTNDEGEPVPDGSYEEFREYAKSELKLTVQRPNRTIDNAINHLVSLRRVVRKEGRVSLRAADAIPLHSEPEVAYQP